MKLIVTSDWHLDALTSGFNRYDDLEAGALEVVSYIRKERADGFAFLGDISDPDNVRSHRAAALAMRIAMMLKGLSVPNIWITGNHDVIEDGYGTHTLSALAHIAPYTTLIDKVEGLGAMGIVSQLNAYIVAFPFVARHQMYDAVEHCSRAKEDYDKHGKGLPVIVMSHLNCEGAKTGSESTTLARGRVHQLPLEQIAKAFPGAVILQGHYHKPQVIEAHGAKVYVPGSLERLRFDEQADKCGWLSVEY